jgi:hypothetical protein
MQAIPRRCCSRELHGWAMLGHRRGPRGQLRIAAIQAQAPGDAYRAADREAGDRMMGQGLGAVAMGIMVVDLVKEMPHVFAQGLIDRHERLASATAMGLCRLPPELEPATIDRVLPPRSLRKTAGKSGFVRTVEDAAGAMGQALVGQDDPSGQVVLKVPELALVLKQIAEDRRLVGDYGSRRHHGPFHHAPPLS